jgi:hypothetical protein
MKLRSLLLLCLLLATFCARLSSVHASQHEEADRLVQTLSVSPLLIDAAGTYAPGSVINLPPVKVTNLSRTELRVKVELKDFVAGGEHGEPRVIAPTDKDYEPAIALSTYLRPDVSEFTLAPQASREVRLQINVPLGAEPGGHYGLVQFVSTTAGAADRPVAARGSVGTLVLLRVAGKTVETGNVASLGAFVRDKTKRLQAVRLVDPMDKQPVVLQTRFRNTGNVHYKPQGTIQIDNLVGGSTTVKLAPETVLPRSVRAQEADWTALPLVAFTKVSATFDFGEINKQRVSADPYYLVIFPWKLALAVIVVILLFVWRDRRREKRFKKMVGRKGSDTAELG